MTQTRKTARRLVAAAVAGALLLALSTAGAPAATAARPTAYLVSAEAAAGFAAPGTSAPADILVLVTDPTTGQAITTLTQPAFVVISHFSHPGQTCGFSNNVVTFANVGTGAYHLQVAPVGCTWTAGDFLLQVLVASGARRGQDAATLTIAGLTR